MSKDEKKGTEAFFTDKNLYKIQQEVVKMHLVRVNSISFAGIKIFWDI